MDSKQAKLSIVIEKTEDESLDKIFSYYSVKGEQISYSVKSTKINSGNLSISYGLNYEMGKIIY